MTDEPPTIPVEPEELAETEYLLRTFADVAQALDDDTLASRAATLADTYQVRRLDRAAEVAES